MRRIMWMLLSALLLTVSQAQESSPKEPELPTVFVAPLDGDRSQIMGWQPALGEGLAEMLITELSRLNKFQVLESTALPELIDEIKLGEAGYVGKEERVEKGGFAGADFMFRGKVTRFGSQEKRTGLGGFVPGSLGNLGVKTTRSDVRIDWRFVDVATRKVIKTGSATEDQKGTSFDVGVAVSGHGGRIGFANQEFMNSALGKAAAKAVTNIVNSLVSIKLPESGRRQQQAKMRQAKESAQQSARDALQRTPGKVLAVVNKTTVIVSLGSQQGFKAGDTLNLYELVEIKDDKGAVVFTEEKPAGEVKLETVQEDRSKASYAGTAEVKSGWTVKAK